MKTVPWFLLLLGACVPDIAQNPPPGPAVVVQFDLAKQVVPAPNDLAIRNGTVAVPTSMSDPPAQAEFTTSYLDTLGGFPHESTAQVRFSGPLDPTTVTAQNVLVLDLTTNSPVPGATPVLEADGQAIDLPPPGGAWTRAHRYAVALIAGPGRLQGAHGEPVIGSPSWALVSTPNHLVECPNGDLTTTDLSSCKLLVDVIPATGSDPAARLMSQLTTAIALEKVRLGYEKLLRAIEMAENLPDATSIPIAWTFTIVDAGEVAFDPAHQVIPFPNDVLMSHGKVALPDPVTQGALTPEACARATNPTVQLYCGLDTLDGFSTIAPPISENGPKGAVAQATLGTMTMPTRQAVGLIALQSRSSAEEESAPLQYTPCVSCLSSTDANGNVTSPEQLQWRLDAPLTERTTYLAYVTSDLTDDQGKAVIASPAFALLRLKNPLYAANRSQVSVLGDGDAQRLEPLRSAMQPAFDLLESGAAGSPIPRGRIALAWTFTTQSEGTTLDTLHTLGSQRKTARDIYALADQTSTFRQIATAGSIPNGAIGAFYTGFFLTTVPQPGPGGFDVTNVRELPVPFLLMVPAGSPPLTGYPVTIFGHGITRDRNDALAIANALASAGQATIATDVIFHGERSSCVGSGAFLSQVLGTPLPDSAACADPLTQQCNQDPTIGLVGRCFAISPSARVACPGLGVAGPDVTGNLGCLHLNQGLCALDKKCEGGDFSRDSGGRPVISGWNVISLGNFFATRDNFRQQVIDLASLVRVLRAAPLDPLVVGATKLDTSKFGYVGQSLGGILGTLYNAVSPDTTNVVLNVPGGDVTQIILGAPSFQTQKAILLGGLAAQKPPIVSGTSEYDQFIATAQWILDPADSANLAWRLTHPVASAPNPGRKAFIQFIEGDQTVPNFSNLALVAAASRPLTGMAPRFGCLPPLYCYEFTEGGNIPFDMTSVPLVGRHGFLLKPPAAPMTNPTTQALALFVAAQTQVATFLSTGTVP